MNEKENTKIKLFGFRINNTVAVILFFLAFTLTISFISQMYVYVEFFIQLSGSSIPESMTYPVIQSVITVVIGLVLFIFYIYVLVVTSKLKKFYRETEDNQMRWFGFRLTSTSLITISVLSIFNIMSGVISLYSNISNLIILNIALQYPLSIVNNIRYTVSIIVSLILMLFYIYTIIICKKTISILENTNPH